MRKNKGNKYQCACCGEYTLDEDYRFQICSNCFWEQEDLQEDDPEYEGGPNGKSLNEYRKEYLEKKKKL